MQEKKNLVLFMSWNDNKGSLFYTAKDEGISFNRRISFQVLFFFFLLAPTSIPFYLKHSATTKNQSKVVCIPLVVLARFGSAGLDLKTKHNI